jgi:dethiobiotin synthetase
MPITFITSTGTNLGKTFVTEGILRYCINNNQDVSALKPIESGFDKNNLFSSDSAKILSAMNKKVDLDSVTSIAPWRFKDPVAPHEAAKIENSRIDYDEVLSFCKQYSSAQNRTLIEGAGGIMVPIENQKTTLDLIKDLNCGIILVVGSYLGTLSHTLTALKVCDYEGINVSCIVINEAEHTSYSLEQCKESLCLFTDIPIKTIPKVINEEKLFTLTPTFAEIYDIACDKFYVTL